MAHNPAEIEAALLQFAREQILADGVDIACETVLRDIGVDSYSVIEMVLFLERKFGITLPQSKLLPENLKSVKALAACAAETAA